MRLAFGPSRSKGQDASNGMHFLLILWRDQSIVKQAEVRRIMERSTRKPAFPHTPGIAMLILALILSCGVRGTNASIPVMIDEAFAALLPETTTSLVEFSDGMRKLPRPGNVEKPAATTPISLAGLDASIGRIMGQWIPGETVPGAVIASPRVAARIAGMTSGTAGLVPPLVVPFASGFAPDSEPGFYAVEHNFEAAYSAMGRKAARYLRRTPDKDGKLPVCGFVFQENFMRGRAAYDAFVEAFQAEIGEGRLTVRTLEPGLLAVDPSGAAKDAIASLLDGDAESGKTAILVLAIADAFVAESAAAGSRNVLFMADQSPWGGEEPGRGLFRYNIQSDEKALARAVIEVARKLAGGRSADKVTTVPLRYSLSFPKIF